MSKICILGNSHLGALAQSEAGAKAFEAAGHDVVYWGAAGTLFPKITYKDGRLISPAPSRSRIISGGRYGHLDLDDFDTLLVYGGSVPLSNAAARIAARMTTLAPLSGAFRTAALNEQIALWWQDRPAGALMQAMIDAHPEKRYIFTPDPLMARNDAYLARISDPVLLRQVLDAMYMHCQTWCDTRGIGFYRQNEHTLAEGRLTTHPSFSTNSVKMEKGEAHPDEDFVHMNGSYGDVVMADLLTLVQSPEQAVRAAG